MRYLHLLGGNGVNVCMCRVNTVGKHRPAYKKVLKTSCSTGGERHTCVQQIRHVRHMPQLKSNQKCNDSVFTVT